MPLIPIRLNEEGAFEGVPFLQTGVTDEGDPEGLDALAWYKYCEHQDAPGLRADWPADDNALEYYLSEDKAALVTPWYADLLGEPVRAEDFPDEEFGASFRWRSEGQGGTAVLTGVIVKYRTRDVRRATEELRPPAAALTEDEWALVRRAVVAERGDSTFVAASTFCTHFCCVPGYKETPLARTYGAEDKMYCSCHNSVFDPREIAAYSFFPTRSSWEVEE